MGLMVVLYGPSAAGKSEIQRRLLEEGFRKVITATTRPIRNNETHGVDYLFLDKESFEDKAARGEFVEWTQYNGEWYGTLRTSIEQAASAPEDAVIILDLSGVLAIKRGLRKGVLAIYIGAGPESLARRLGERGGDPAEAALRLQKALEQELTEAYMQPADAVIWNNDGTGLDDALAKVKAAIASFRSSGG